VCGREGGERLGEEFVAFVRIKCRVVRPPAFMYSGDPHMGKKLCASPVGTGEKKTKGKKHKILRSIFLRLDG